MILDDIERRQVNGYAATYQINAQVDSVLGQRLAQLEAVVTAQAQELQRLRALVANLAAALQQFDGDNR